MIEAETQEEGEAGSMLGARRRTRSRDSRIAPWAKGRCQTAEPPRDPLTGGFKAEERHGSLMRWKGHLATVLRIVLGEREWK